MALGVALERGATGICPSSEGTNSLMHRLFTTTFGGGAGKCHSRPSVGAYPARTNQGASGSQVSSIHWHACPNSGLDPRRPPFSSEMPAQAGASVPAGLPILANSGRTPSPPGPGSATVGNRGAGRKSWLGGGRCVRYPRDRSPEPRSCSEPARAGAEVVRPQAIAGTNLPPAVGGGYELPGAGDGRSGRRVDAVVCRS